MAKKPKFDNTNTGALFAYCEGVQRGMHDHDGVQCDLLLKDGKLSVTLKGANALVAAGRVPHLPTEQKRPVKFDLVLADGKKTKRPMVIFVAESEEHGTFWQVKPDTLVVEHPAGLDALLG